MYRLGEGSAVEHNMYMREHRYSTYDHWFYNGLLSETGSFFDIGKVLSRNYMPRHTPLLFSSLVWQKNEVVFHERKCFDVMMVLGSLGGIGNVMIIIFGFLLFPISEHSFLMKAFKKFYFARTKDQTLFPQLGEFRQNKLNEKIDGMLPKEAPKEAGDKIKSEIYMHRIIRIKAGLSCKLFFAKLMGPFFPNGLCCLPSNKVSKYMRLYERAEERVENELDICYIIKTLRNLNIFMKNTSMTKQVKFEIMHSKLNLINLDEDSFSDSSDGDDSSEEEGQKSMFEEAGISKGPSKVANSTSEGGAKYAETTTPGRPIDNHNADYK